MDCAESHKRIYYKRLTPVPKDVSMSFLVKNTWGSKGNVLNKDFKLYGSLEDLRFDTNAWKFCNYDDKGVGGLRDCGPTAAISGQWNSVVHPGGKRVLYMVLTNPITAGIKDYVYNAPRVVPVAEDGDDGTCGTDEPTSLLVGDYEYIAKPNKVTKSYAELVQVCKALNKRICKASEICDMKERKLIAPSLSEIPGDSWNAVGDSENEWLTLTTSGDRFCKKHTEVAGIKPAWGLNNHPIAFTRSVKCCNL